MPNQPDTQDILKDFLPAETPMETPSQEPVTEQPTPEEQTVETNSPEAEVVVSTETPTATDSEKDKLKEDRAYWQTRAQNALKELQVAKAKEVEPPPVTIPPAVPVAPTEPQQLSEDEIEEMLREKPTLALQVLAAHQEKRLASMLDERERQQKVQQAFEREREVAAATLDRYINENKISEDELKEATAHMTQMGIKASPAGANDYIIKHIEFNRLLHTAAQSVEKVKVETAQAVKQQALTIQPGGGQQPQPATPKSTTELIREKFTKTRGQKVLDELFG